MTIELGPLNKSGYIRTQESEPIKGYYRYILSDNSSENAVKTARRAIEELIRKNEQLVILSGEEVSREIRNNKYLTINGDAVCFSNEESAASFFQPDQIDFFTRTVLREPVSCERGRHTFEKKFIEQWVLNKRYYCPYAQGHEIGDVKVDEEVLTIVERAKKDFLKEKQKRERQTEILSQFKANNDKALEKANQHLQEVNRRGDVCCAGVVKIALKVSLKAVPIVSVISGISMGVYRLTREESWEAIVAELVSGFTGCLPGLGLASSVVIDGGLIFYDGKKFKENWDSFWIEYRKAKEASQNRNQARDQALRDFGFSVGEDPSQKETSSRHRALSSATHPDGSERFGKGVEKELNQVQAEVNEGRDILHSHENIAEEKKE